MNKALALVLAVGFLSSMAVPAEAKHGGRWNRNDCRFDNYRGCDNNNLGFRRAASWLLFGNRNLRHDNGRHLGWYKNGKANRYWF